MPIPLLIIGAIVLVVIMVILFVQLLPFIKFIMVVLALAAIYKLLPDKAKKLENWQVTVVGISLLAALLTISSHFGFFAAGSLPLAVEQTVAPISPHPVVLVLSFIIFVLAFMYIKKDK